MLQAEQVVDGIADLQSETSMAGAYQGADQRLHQQRRGRADPPLPEGSVARIPPRIGSHNLSRADRAAAAGARASSPSRRPILRRHRAADQLRRLELDGRSRCRPRNGLCGAGVDAGRDRRDDARGRKTRRRSRSSSIASARAHSTRASAPRRPRSARRSAAIPATQFTGAERAQRRAGHLSAARPALAARDRGDSDPREQRLDHYASATSRSSYAGACAADDHAHQPAQRRLVGANVAPGAMLSNVQRAFEQRLRALDLPKSDHRHSRPPAAISRTSPQTVVGDGDLARALDPARLPA